MSWERFCYGKTFYVFRICFKINLFTGILSFDRTIMLKLNTNLIIFQEYFKILNKSIYKYIKFC